ncbi:MAG: hypothetical protein R3A48_05875 [Polyangiales bacterium]
MSKIGRAAESEPEAGCTSTPARALTLSAGSAAAEVYSGLGDVYAPPVGS